MTRVRPSPARFALAVALAAATAALALVLRQSPAAVALLAALALATLASPWLEWVSVPPPLARWLPRAHGWLLLVGALVAWLSRSMGVLVLDSTLVPLLAAAVLAPMATVFALAPRAFAPGGTLVPAVVCLLAVAGLDPAPRGYGGSALPFLRDADHNGFAERYLPLAVVVVVALWASALLAHGPRWRSRDVAGAAVSALLAVALAATGIVGLPLFQPRVEQAVASALDQGATGLSGESTLGEFAELAVSRRRVLDLRSSLLSGGRWRLPSEVFTRFDGRRWSNTAPPSPRGKSAAPTERLTLLRPVPSPGVVSPLLDGIASWFRASGAPGDVQGTVELRVDQSDVGGWPLLLPRRPLAVAADASFLEEDRFGLLRRPPGDPLTLYGALLSPALSSPGAVPGPTLSDEEREESLALPPRVDPRVSDLALELERQSPDPRGRLSATVLHLQTRYRYTLAPGAFRPGGDPLAEFLFEKKAAYCEYFASAAVVLLRLQGVPARFVKGLSVGAQTDVGGGLHVVRESDAHAWIEAWVPGEGWVEEDPTPPGQFEGARAPASGFDRLLQRARAALASAWNQLRVRGPAAFLGWLGRELGARAGRAAREPLAWLLALLVTLGPRLVRSWRARRRRRQEAAHEPGVAVPAGLRAIVRDLERRWAALGCPRPAGCGLLEHARALATDRAPGPPVPAALLAAGREVVEAYYCARFGNATPGKDEISHLRDALRG